MLNLKKTAVAVLAFASSTAFAGTMGPVCAPDNVTVPCEKSAWSVGAKALYLQPTYTGALSFLTDNNNIITGASIDGSPKWSWGFQVEGAYHFNTGNDFNVNWYHLGGKTSHSYVPDSLEFPGGAALAAAPSWDAVNLELGQHVNIGKVDSLRLHGGVQFGRIKTDINGSSADGAAAIEMRYNGFGPRVGADMGYELGNGLGVYANAATALLVGNSRVQVGSIDNTGIQYGSLKSTIVVPELEAKLGLNYGYAMAQGDLGLDVGYMWVNYFNAQQVNASSTSNFGVHGPFVGLKWVGSVA